MSNRVVSWQQGIARNRSECDPRYQHLWDGLVGAWYPKLGPTGATLRDVSGHHNHGVLTNMDPATDWGLGEDGWVLDFDGGDDHVTLDTGTMQWLPTGFTVGIRYWADSISNYRGVACCRTFDPDIGWSFNAANSKIELYNKNLTPAAVTSTSNWPTGRWVDIAATWDGDNTRIYIDGVLDKEATHTGTPSNATFAAIGTLRDSSSYFADGRLYHCCKWDRALSAAEIRTLHETRGNCLIARPDYGWLYGPTPGGTPYYYNYLNRLWGEA